MTVTSFLTLEQIKINLNIGSSVTLHDDKLLEIIFNSDAHIDAVLQSYTDVPVTTGSALYTIAREAALYYARILYFEYVFQLDKVEYNQRIFNDKLEALMQMLKAQRTSRTKTVLVAEDPREKNLRLPSQKDTFVLGDY